MYTLYLTGLKCILNVTDCSYFGKAVPTWDYFKSLNIVCWGMPHAYLGVTAFLMLPVYVLFGFAAVIQHSEFEPQSKMFMRRYVLKL